MPQHDKIAVIGAGIIGCSIAWRLQTAGFKVLLFDKNPQAFQGISSAGFGSLTPFSDPFYVGEARDFAAGAVELYRKRWVPELSEKCNEKIAFSDLGLLQLCLNKSDFDIATRHAKELLKAGYSAEVLSTEETRSLEPAVSADIEGSLWLNEPWLDREQYYNALSRLLGRSGNVEIHYDCRVQALHDRENSLVLTTRDGMSFELDSAIVCTGLTTDGIEGVRGLPLQWIRGDAISIHTVDGMPVLKRHVYCHDGFVTPRTGSEMLLGATYIEGGTPSGNSLEHRDRIQISEFQHILAANRRILPQLYQFELSHVWRNWRPTAPDSRPILGADSSHPRVVFANGFIGLGLTLAPNVAECITEYLVSGKSSVFPSTFSPEREALRPLS